MIVVIHGPPKSGKSFVATALRDLAQRMGRGVLLIDEDQDGEPERLVEKLLRGEFVKGAKVSDLPWKPAPQIIVVNKGGDKLSEIESVLPGFTKAFGPVVLIDTKVAA